MAPLHSHVSDKRQLDLLERVDAFYDNACDNGPRLAVPCGNVNALGVRCLGLGTRPVRIEGQIQYNVMRTLVHCDWEHCYLAAGMIATVTDMAKTLQRAGR